MANLGDIRISTDYQVLKQGPMDARLKKKTKSDLINPESWASSGSDVYVYPTMLVGIEDSGEIYKLLSVENIFAEDYSGWELLGSNASTAPEIYIGSEEPTDENVVVWYDPNDNIEDPWTVDSELNESSSNPIANKAVTVKINELQNTQSEIETSLSEKLSETTADSKYQPKGDYLTVEDLPEMPELATVATTGSYEDLSNKPTFKTINNQEITGEGNIEIEVVSDIVVDSAISETSENPVQNKVVKSYVDNAIANIPQSEGLELRELKTSGTEEDNAYNLETLELMRENKVLPAMNGGDGTLTPLTYVGDGQFILQVAQMGIDMQMSLTMAEDGSITGSHDFVAPYILNSPSKVLEWLTKSATLAQIGKHEPVYVFYDARLCLVDFIEAGGTGSTRAVVQFNYGSQRFERVYNATTGEEISTTEIPLGGDSIEVIDNLESTETTSALSANQGKVLKELVDSKMDSTTFKTINGNEITGEGDIDTNQKYTIYFTTEEGTTLTDEQKASNKVIYDLAVEGKAPMWCYSMNNELPLQFYGMQTESDITYAAYVYDQIVSKTDEKSENVYLLVGVKEDGDIYTNGTFGYNILHEDAVLNAINGSGTGGGLETRILYVPELTAGSELTDEEKAYNAETCQKLVAGTARAFITDGKTYAYTDSIIDLTELMGSGYAIYFDQPAISAVGGFILDGGDILMSVSPVSPTIIVTEETQLIDVFSSMLMPLLTGKALPTFYLSYSGSNYIATLVRATDEGLGLIYDAKSLTMSAIIAVGSTFFISFEFPSTLTVGSPSAVDANIKWMKNVGASYEQWPMISHYNNTETLYTPVYIKRYGGSITYADFCIIRNGAIEVWRIQSDGTSSLVTE